VEVLLKLVLNGYVIFKVSANGLEEVIRNVEMPDQVLCAYGCTGETDNCVYFVYGCRHRCEVLRVSVFTDNTPRIKSVVLFNAFPEHELTEEDDFNPNEVTAVHFSLNTGKGRYGCLIAGNSSGNVVIWEIGLATGDFTSLGALPSGDEGEESTRSKEENKVKCISRYSNAVAAVTLGDATCRVWDFNEKTLKHTFHAEDFGLDKTSRPLMRYCCFSHTGSSLTVAAASRNMKAKNAGCWLATKAVDRDDPPTVISLSETKTLASCSIIEHVDKEEMYVSLGNTDADALGFKIKNKSATCVAVQRNCHGFVTTATNCIQLPNSEDVLFISAGTDGTCRIHHSGKKSGIFNLKTMGIIVGVVAAIASIAFYAFKQ